MSQSHQDVPDSFDVLIQNTRVLESVQETLEIGRKAKVSVVISHHHSRFAKVGG